MEKQDKKRLDAKPAGYPRTSATEQEVRDIFHFLLDRKFIQGDIRTLDKVPNSDGILEITDKDQFPLGKIDIQLKTLQPRNYKNPGYQVDASLLAYCDIAVLPVILIVVNKDQKRAYWKYFDRKTLLEVTQKIKGKSVSVSIPVENCIDGANPSYIIEWTKIVAETVCKSRKYDEVVDDNNTLQQNLKMLQTKLETPTNLPMQVLKEIHEFIDIYNYILDREFNFVKRYLYPNYWKIGIGVLKYDLDGFNYLLYPVEFQKEQTLVKSVKHEDYKDIYREMHEGNILSIVSKFSTDIIQETPWVYAYSELENKIKETIEKYTFIIPDEFSANEYLISFIDKFSGFLDFQPNQDSYLLKDLKLKLFSILPLVIAESYHYDDSIVEDRHIIDHRTRISNQEYHRKKIQEAITKISENYVPKVKVTLESQLYSFNAIKFYISWLEELGFDKTIRVYSENSDIDKHSRYTWQKWSKEILFSNFRLLSENFNRVYETCLNEYFQNIKEYLVYPENSEHTLIHVLNCPENDLIARQPHLQTFHLRPLLWEKGTQYFYLIEDEKLPINREKYWPDECETIIISEKKYQVVMTEGQPMDFMFKISPMNELLKLVINRKLRLFFKQRKSHERILTNDLV